MDNASPTNGLLLARIVRHPRRLGWQLYGEVVNDCQHKISNEGLDCAVIEEERLAWRESS